MVVMRLGHHQSPGRHRQIRVWGTTHRQPVRQPERYSGTRRFNAMKPNCEASQFSNTKMHAQFHAATPHSTRQTAQGGLARIEPRSSPQFETTIEHRFSRTTPFLSPPLSLPPGSTSPSLSWSSSSLNRSRTSSLCTGHTSTVGKVAPGGGGSPRYSSVGTWRSGAAPAPAPPPPPAGTGW